MPLNKIFKNKTPNFFQVSRLRLIIGILIFFFYSFTFYSFLQVSREVLRVFSITENYDLLVLNDREVHFYNLIFAVISLIFGQSICLIYWIDRPKRIFGSHNYRKSMIINDQKVLNWVFMYWFAKICIVFFVVFVCLVKGGFYCISIFQDYRYIFVLLIIALFLQTWNTINLIFKTRGQKWMLISGVIILVVAFGYSRINLIEYKTLNQIVLKNNIQYSYKLELPETEYYEFLEKRALVENIFIVLPKNSDEDSEPLIVVDNEIIDLEQLPDKIKECQISRSYLNRAFIVYRLNIHKTIKMKFVNQLKQILNKSGVIHIAYAVIPKYRDYADRYYQGFSFPLVLPNKIVENIKQNTNLKEDIRKSYKINISLNKERYLINDTLIKSNKVNLTIKKLIQNNPDYVIFYKVNENAAFLDYFEIYSSTKKAVTELRNEYSLQKFNMKYESLSCEETIEVRKVFPFRIFETTAE